MLVFILTLYDKKEENFSMSKLKLGVVGQGFIGNLHSRIIHELHNADLVAVADTDKDSLRKAKEDFGCEVYENYNDLFNKADIDAVSICMPDHYHLEPVLAAAAAGKHILCEKPIATSFDEALKMKEASEKAGVRLMIAHLLRFDPRYVAVQEQITNGSLGEILHLRGKRQNPRPIVERLGGKVSMLFYVGIHDIDIVQWYAGSRITRVYAQKVAKINKSHDSEDCIFFLANLGNASIATFEFSWSLPSNFPAGIYSGIEVVGSKGAGYVDVLEQGVRIYKEVENSVEYPDTLHWPETNGRIMGDLRDEIEHFADAVLNEKEFIVPTDDAISAVAVIEAVFESLKTNKPVDVRQI